MVIRQALVPMVSFYIVIMAVLAAGVRMSRRAPGQPSQPGAVDRQRDEDAARPRPLVEPGPGWRLLINHYAITAIGGYLLLMAIVLIYYFGVARVGGNFIESAFTGCAMLVGLTVPLFAAASWLAERNGWRF